MRSTYSRVSVPPSGGKGVGANVSSCVPAYSSALIVLHAFSSHDRVEFSYVYDDIFLRRHIFHMYDDDCPMVSVVGFQAPAAVVPGSHLQCQALLRSQVLISIYNCFLPLLSMPVHIQYTSFYRVLNLN